MSTQERIKQEAYSHALTNYSGTEISEYIMAVSMHSHEAGALSERNKTIEEVIQLITKERWSPWHEVYDKIQSLKV